MLSMSNEAFFLGNPMKRRRGDLDKFSDSNVRGRGRADPQRDRHSAEKLLTLAARTPASTRVEIGAADAMSSL
jgi:hypothetical protein